MPFSEYKKSLENVAGLKALVKKHFDVKDKREMLLRMEFVLEGLHHNNVIARETEDTVVRYADVLSDMLRGMEGNA